MSRQLSVVRFFKTPNNCDDVDKWGGKTRIDFYLEPVSTEQFFMSNDVQ